VCGDFVEVRALVETESGDFLLSAVAVSLSSDDDMLPCALYGCALLLVSSMSMFPSVLVLIYRAEPDCLVIPYCCRRLFCNVWFCTADSIARKKSMFSYFVYNFGFFCRENGWVG